MFDTLTTQQNGTHANLLEQPQSAAWLNLEQAAYKLPAEYKQQLLNLESDKFTGSKEYKASHAIASLFESRFLEQSDSDHRLTPQVLKQLNAAEQPSTAEFCDHDSLTGLGSNQAIAGQTENTLTGFSFRADYGYGLVNAAAAVAWSAGYYPFADVPDWGGVNWGNDMVKAPEVWNAGFKGENITVAVIDSGVDIHHPDLDDNIWYNSGEIAGDGIDNDFNGYIDDIAGWNFAVDEYNNNVLPGTTDPGQSHGTHVAGTIAAEANSFGTTGVAPNAKIMALRLGDVSGNQYTNAGSLAEAIYYAVDNGAQVINMSLGWTETPELVAAMAYAASRNVITVSSAGNKTQVSPGTPAKYATDFGISVGAVDYYGNLADFSNGAGYDSRMQHVVAPGVEIWSTLPTDNLATSWYGTSDGTSMAAPHVAGVVALMLSANPYLTHAEVRYILTQSATGYSYASSSTSSTAEQDPIGAIANLDEPSVNQV